MSFQGFPPETFKFLRALKRNNRREWFQPRKDQYLTEVHAPMAALTEELAKLCAGFARDWEFNPKKNVQRVYRDTRFSPDKTPYKTHIAASFKPRQRAKTQEGPNLYVQVSPGDTCSAGGVYKPSSLMLRKIRQAILADPIGWEEIRTSRPLKKHFGDLAGESLKTQPRGIDPHHEWIEDLKRTQFFVYREYTEKQAQNPRFARQIADDFKAMLPLIAWLKKSSQIW